MRKLDVWSARLAAALLATSAALLLWANWLLYLDAREAVAR